jgi:hypothetical protein
MENEMKIQSASRMFLVTAVTFALFVLAAVLLKSPRFVEATTFDGSTSTLDAEHLRSALQVPPLTLPHSTAAYNGVMAPARTLYAPWLRGSTSSLRVLNTSESAATTVRATFYSDGSLIGTTETVLGAGAVGQIRTGALTTGTVFSAVLSAGQPIVAVVNDFGSHGKQATSYAAMDAGLGRRFLALPYLLHASGGGWESDVVIQNVGNDTAHVTVVYTRTNELTTTNWSDVLMLPAGGIQHLDLSQVGLPEKFEGVATIRADQNLIAVVHSAAYDLGSAYPRLAYIYRVPLIGGTDGVAPPLYFPLLVNAFEDWETSEIQIMNAAAARARFSLEIDAVTSGPFTIAGWSADSFAQNASDSPSPSGEAAAGRVQQAQSLHSLVWLNGQGRFRGDFLAAYSTPSVGGRTWYLPHFDQGLASSTYVAVQKLTDDAVDVTLTFHTLTGTLSAPYHVIQDLDMALYTGDVGLPSSFVGGVVVETDQPVVAVAVIAGRLVLDKVTFLPVSLKNR